MDALYNQFGQTVAWLDRLNGDVVDLAGRHIAFVHGDSVYDVRGRHRGWWKDGVIRDSYGAASAFVRGARNAGVALPLPSLPPLPPLKALRPLRPLKQLKPLKPLNSWSWSTNPFIR